MKTETVRRGRFFDPVVFFVRAAVRMFFEISEAYLGQPQQQEMALYQGMASAVPKRPANHRASAPAVFLFVK